MYKMIMLIFFFSTELAFASTPKKVLMIINEGFQVDEYFIPRKLFEKEGYKIKTASKYGGLVNPGKKYVADYKPVQTDLSFEQIKIEDYDAITFAGGAGAWTDYFPNKTIHQILINSIKRKQMIVGLICAGTGLLATANNLDGTSPQFKGRHVTGYGEVSGLLTSLGQVKYDSGDLTKPYVVEDGNLITGRDPSSSKLFAEIVIKKLNKEK
ncbi:MAG: DJ-1/PfpI family protein [Bdellovibrionota bacterium]